MNRNAVAVIVLVLAASAVVAFLFVRSHSARTCQEPLKLHQMAERDFEGAAQEVQGVLALPFPHH